MVIGACVLVSGILSSGAVFLFAALKRGIRVKDYFKTIHISDNNRHFPGLGCLNFHELVRFLMAIDFQGTLTIEGNVKNDFESDLELSAQYLKSIFDRCLN